MWRLAKWIPEITCLIILSIFIGLAFILATKSYGDELGPEPITDVMWRFGLLPHLNDPVTFEIPLGARVLGAERGTRIDEETGLPVIVVFYVYPVDSKHRPLGHEERTWRLIELGDEVKYPMVYVDKIRMGGDIGGFIVFHLVEIER